MNEFLRIFLPTYLLVFLGAAFLWRSIKVQRSTRTAVVRIWNNPGAEGFIGRAFGIMPLFSVLVIGAFLWGPKAMGMLATFGWLTHPWAQGAGAALMSLCLLGTILAQHQMGDSWRIGIDHENRTELIISGLFRYSRNPIFLCMQLNLFGFFLIVPTGVTLALLTSGCLLMQIQVRLEEEQLECRHGQSYQNYRSRVARWWGRA